MGSYHAKLSPSSAHRWSSCTASVAAQEGLPNEGSDASRRGTTGHQMHAEMLLDPAIDPQSYRGRGMAFWVHPESHSYGETWLCDELPEGWSSVDILHEVVVDQTLIEEVMTSLNFLREEIALHGGELIVEQSVPIGHITGEEGATGSVDFALLSGDTLRIRDLKLGRGKVDAYEVVVPAHLDIITNTPVAEVTQPNLQLAFYALGLVEQFGMLYDFKYVSLAIIQPPIHHVSEYTCSIDELLAVGEFLRKQARAVRLNPEFSPSTDNCHFCRAKGPGCAAQTKFVLETTLEGFEDVDTAQPKAIDENKLGSLYAALPLIRTWCDAVSDKVHDHLARGLPVVRNDGVSYKLVEGKQLPRRWTDEAEAAAEMLKLAVPEDVVYEKSVISPTAAEKLSKAKRVKKGETPAPTVLQPEGWAALQALIAKGQKGQPQVALETDPRPALAQASDGFDEVPIESPDADDLLN